MSSRVRTKCLMAYKKLTSTLNKTFLLSKYVNAACCTLLAIALIFFTKWLNASAKGQLVSKCPFGVIVWTKIPTKFFPGFLPQPLKRGQIKTVV